MQNINVLNIFHITDMTHLISWITTFKLFCLPGPSADPLSRSGVEQMYFIWKE